MKILHSEMSSVATSSENRRSWVRILMGPMTYDRKFLYRVNSWEIIDAKKVKCALIKKKKYTIQLCNPNLIYHFYLKTAIVKHKICPHQTLSFSDFKWALIIVISRIVFSYHRGKSIFYRYHQSLDIKELPHNFEHELKRKKREKAEQGTEAAAIFCCLSTCHIFFPSDVFIISYTDQRKAMQLQDKKNLWHFFNLGVWSFCNLEIFCWNQSAECLVIILPCLFNMFWLFLLFLRVTMIPAMHVQMMVPKI